LPTTTNDRARPSFFWLALTFFQLIVSVVDPDGRFVALWLFSIVWQLQLYWLTYRRGQL
jgi:hypothetical protein